MPGGMKFVNTRFDFDQGNRLVSLNDLNGDEEVQQAILDIPGVGGIDESVVTEAIEDHVEAANPHTQYSLAADAAPLSSDTPLAPVAGGYAGDTGEVSDAGHQHPPQFVMPGYPIVPPGSQGGRLFFAQPITRRSATNHSLTSTKALGTPLPVYRAYQLQQLRLELGVASDAGNYTVALYRGRDEDNLPWGAPVWSLAPAAATATGIKTISSLAIDLTPGMYYLFFGVTGFTTTRALPKVPQNTEFGQMWIPQVSSTNNTDNPGLSLANYDELTGTWPTITGYSDFTTLNGNTLWWYSVNGVAA
jgi:hypothetical protein